MNDFTQLNTPLDRFFQNIKICKKELRRNRIHETIRPFIFKKDLRAIFKFVLKNKGAISSELAGQKNNALRIKKSGTLKRTINIVQTLSGEFALILGTKSKLKTGKKSKVIPGNKGSTNKPAIPTFEGKMKRGKPCWRIDVTPPTPWVDMVCKHRNIKQRKIFKRELVIIRQLANVCHEQNVDLITTSLCGEPYFKPASNGNGQNGYISLFSKRAKCTLFNYIYQIDQISLKNKLFLIKDLLRGVQLIHSQGIIHQDLKADNILIGKYASKEYRFQIADFGLSFDEKKSKGLMRADATYEYASPELFLAYDNPRQIGHAYYHVTNEHCESYGKEIYKKINQKKQFNVDSTFSFPHAKNDIWSTGILIFEILFKTLINEDNPEHRRLINQNPLLKGMLNPIRSARFSIHDAIDTYNRLLNTDISVFHTARSPEAINASCLPALLISSHPSTSSSSPASALTAINDLENSESSEEDPDAFSLLSSLTPLMVLNSSHLLSPLSPLSPLRSTTISSMFSPSSFSDASSDSDHEQINKPLRKPVLHHYNTRSKAKTLSLGEVKTVPKAKLKVC